MNKNLAIAVSLLYGMLILDVFFVASLPVKGRSMSDQYRSSIFPSARTPESNMEPLPDLLHHRRDTDIAQANPRAFDTACLSVWLDNSQ